jgi:hypothetical protein
MKRPMKIAVLCFSTLLFSGYVYLRAGGNPKVFPGSKSAGVVAPTTQRVFVIEGSKSTVLSAQGQITAPPGQPASQPSAEFTLRPQDPRTTPPSTSLSVGPATTLPVFFPGTKTDGVGYITSTGARATLTGTNTMPAQRSSTRPAATTRP